MKKVTIKNTLGLLKDFVDFPTVGDQLCALTPHDGRYACVAHALTNYCSEAGLQRLRLLVEIEYLIYANKHCIDFAAAQQLRAMYETFDHLAAMRIKAIEGKINHDVKAIEYYICENLDKMNMSALKPHVHKYLTSEDVTNAAIGMMVFMIYSSVMRPELLELLRMLSRLTKKWKDQPMLARTHGQPASPTTVGKELAIYVSRIHQIVTQLDHLPITIKWNGATGNYNAHDAAEPERSWMQFSTSFVQEHLGFDVEMYTAQTHHYLYLADILHQYKNLCSVLIDLCQDMWLYISYDNFKLRLKEGEVGSSVMPHKVNPIDFENAEGNLGLAEVNFGFLASTLQKSRMQRDLSDSTTLRNLGVHFGSLLIALTSVKRGLGKIDINVHKLERDLDDNPAVLAEAIQSIMRKYDRIDGYDKLKDLTRGKKVDLTTLQDFCAALRGQIPGNFVEFLSTLTPRAYTGLALELTVSLCKDVDPEIGE